MKPQYERAEQNGKNIDIYLNTGKTITIPESILTDYISDKKGINHNIQEWLDENWDSATKEYYEKELSK